MRVLQLEVRAGTAVKLVRRALAQRLGQRRPLFASFFVTSRCNLRCAHCCFYAQLPGGAEERDVPTARCVEILQALGRERVPVVVLAGGEPFLRGDLPQLVAAGREAGLSLGIITNGLRGSPATLAAVDVATEWVMFSPHVPEEIGNGAGESRWQEAWEGFGLLRQHLRRPFLGCAVTLSRLTAPRLDEIIARALDGGADGVKFQPVFAPALFPSSAEAAEMARVIGRWRARAPRRVLAPRELLEQIPGFFGAAPRVPCTADRHFHVGVYPDGSVSACCPQRIDLGNVLEGPLDYGRRVAPPLQCYGCQRLDILTSLRVCGRGRS